MSRYSAYIASWLLLLASVPLALRWPGWWWGVVAGGLLVLLGSWDLLQTRTTLRRNYPILAHFRYGLESVGPEMRQYFIESDTAEAPFSRQQRTLVYRRAKNVMDVVPFGSLQDPYAVDYEWINHSLAPTRIADHDFRIVVGAGRRQPYVASVFNISAMSFGSLSANARSTRAPGAAASTTTPARARSRRTTWRTAATWSGKSARATSAAATPAAASIRSASPGRPRGRRCG